VYAALVIRDSTSK